MKIFYSVSSDGTNSYAEYTNEYLVGKSVFGGTMNSTDSSGAMSILRLGASASEANKIIFGRAWWINALGDDNPRGYQVPSDPGGTGFGDPDSIALYNQIFSLYASFATRGSDLYTITATNFQRRTPMNVFVGLDSPEASAFIRTDPTMQGLSAEDRKKKLEDMLDASNEYLLKQLGITGSSAKPSETTMPDSWEQAATYGGKDAENRKKIKDMLNDPKDPFYLPPGKGQPGKGRGGADSWLPLASKQGNQDTEVAVKGVGGSPGQEYIDPNKGKKFVPPPKDFQRPGSPPVKKATSGSGVKDYGNVAAGYGAGGPNPYGTRGAEPAYKHSSPMRIRVDGKMKNINADDPGQWPSILKKASNKKKTMDVAHYEPKGEVLSEKKRLKSVKDATSKIPGYYDGKPAPLGFPMQEPPKMVNGKHPDLVDGKKIANRFNRLDPASAKAMPKTGNPHIDKKVKAAAKKPK